MIPYLTRFSKKPHVNSRPGDNPKWLDCPAPPATDSDTFAAQMDEVAEVCAQAARDEWPYEFLSKYGLDPEVPAPLQPHVMVEEWIDGELVQVKSALRAAELVRMDHPLDLGIAIREWLATKGHRYRHSSVRDGDDDFLYGVVWFDLQVLMSVFSALVIAWGLKYTWWIVRFEEWFGANITRYKVGCPGHPGDPAGHGAAAGATVAQILKHFRWSLPGDVTVEVVQSGLHFATYRTPAGMHRQVENLRGFVVGWATVRRVSFAEAAKQIREIVPELAV